MNEHARKKVAGRSGLSDKPLDDGRRSIQCCNRRGCAARYGPMDEVKSSRTALPPAIITKRKVPVRSSGANRQWNAPPLGGGTGRKKAEQESRAGRGKTTNDRRAAASRHSIRQSGTSNGLRRLRCSSVSGPRSLCLCLSPSLSSVSGGISEEASLPSAADLLPDFPSVCCSFLESPRSGVPFLAPLPRLLLLFAVVVAGLFFAMSPLYVGLVVSVILMVAGLDGTAGGSSSPWLGDGFPRRSLLRDLGGGGGVGSGEVPDVAVELNSSTFDAVLGDSPARFAVVEFFASWCPACRNYKPHYEKVAKIFNGAGAVHPGIVVMARVDCAQKVNVKLCDKFSVSHYPTLLWGPPTKFRKGQWKPEKEGSRIEAIEIQDARTAQLLLDCINKRIGSSFGLEDEKFDNENSLPHNASDPEQISRAFYDVEEATVEAFNHIIQYKMIKPKTQAALIKFLQLIVAHHPSKRCRKGSAEVLVNFDDLWSLNYSLPNSKEFDIIDGENNAASDFHICGKEIPRGYWIFCRGSKKDTRGFSCGLWILLHSLTVRVRDEESALTFTTICEFIHNFFGCKECSRHFYEMCSRVDTPPKTTRELALWLWRAHNQINERLMKEEKELTTGDPKFPKMMWPPSQLCPSCRHDAADVAIKWDEDEVFNFLERYYGAMLKSAEKDVSQINHSSSESVDDVAPTTSAVAVPAGAALAIALASCAFGALACFWRAQQKKRKYFRQLHSLKNI